ncbi:MAG: TadE/TadG family type IV pilus assembly protein [Rhizobiaceae bacterium]
MPVTKRLRAFLRNESGNFAIIFSICALPLLGLAGMVVDYSRMRSAEQQLQAAVDTAAIAAANGGRDVNDMRRIAAAFVESNAPDYEVDVDTSVQGHKLTIVAETKLALPIMSAVGHPVANISVTTEIESPRLLGGGSVAMHDASGITSRQLESAIQQARQQIRQLTRNMPQAKRQRIEKRLEAEIKRLRATNGSAGSLRFVK